MCECTGFKWWCFEYEKFATGEYNATLCVYMEFKNNLLNRKMYYSCMDVSYVPAPQYDGRSGCLQVSPPQSPLVSLFWYGKGAIYPLTCRSWSDVEDYHIKFNKLFVVLAYIRSVYPYIPLTWCPGVPYITYRRYRRSNAKEKLCILVLSPFNFCGLLNWMSRKCLRVLCTYLPTYLLQGFGFTIATTIIPSSLLISCCFPIMNHKWS